MDLFSGTLGISAPFHTLCEGQVRPPAGLQARFQRSRHPPQEGAQERPGSGAGGSWVGFGVRPPAKPLPP